MPLPQIIAYLRDPARRTFIEAELPESRRDAFAAEYLRRTGQMVPRVADHSPYYVFPPGTNKWGLELRLYFVSNENIPADLEAQCVENSRPGYDEYDRRLNKNDIILELFSNGFVLGTQ